MNEEHPWDRLRKDLDASSTRRAYGRPDRFPGPDCPPLPLFDARYRKRAWTAGELAHFEECEYCQWTLGIAQRGSNVPAPAAPPVLPGPWAAAVFEPRAAAATPGQATYAAPLYREHGLPLGGWLQVFAAETTPGRWSLRLRFPRAENAQAAEGAEPFDRFNHALFEVSYSRPGLPERSVHFRVAFDNRGDLVSHQAPVALEGEPDDYRWQARWVGHAVPNPEAASRRDPSDTPLPPELCHRPARKRRFFTAETDALWIDLGAGG